MRRFLLVLLAVAAGLTGCGVSKPVLPPRPAPSFAPSPVPSAPAPTVVPTVAAACVDGVEITPGDRDAAMGLRVMGISIVNCGSSPYRMKGYPVVLALDEDKTVLPVRVIDGLTEISVSLPNDDGDPKTIVLRPGERATATVAWRNTYDDISNPPVTVPYLRIAPQSGRDGQIVEGGLDLGSTGRIGVSRWQASPRR